jgi:hypothetical protein
MPENMVRLTLWMSQRERQALEEYANRPGEFCSLNYVVRRAVREYLDLEPGVEGETNGSRSRRGEVS